jgi:hypothetical protein
MNVARHSKRLLAALMASTLAVVDVHAAVTDIFSQPLATTSTVVAKPNIMFILDNSGSMASAYMPDDMSDTGKYGFGKAEQFDPGKRIETQIEFDVHRGIQHSCIGLGLTYEFRNDRAGARLKSWVILAGRTSSTLSLFLIFLSLQFLLLDFKPFQFACDRSRKRLITNCE